MEIKIHRSLTDDNTVEIVPDAFKFSYLMLDGGEMKEAVYCTVMHMLRSNDGCFFSITDNGQKVAYGLFSYGKEGRKVRRLYYFAVEREFRGSGLGKKALELALKTEVDTDYGCTVACRPELRSFYEQVGFKYYCPAEDKVNEIVLAYVSSKIMTIEQCVNQIICLVEIQPEAIEIFSEVKRTLKKFGIRPPKHAPKKKSH
ncbi:GNAT family N-acetyltransferase [Pseudoalteromonas sp. BSi20439]|uniref:GNAT family N-acetyltransferase n=1 Tax=Pseudoalteromonas sp. BSi20439 TaxID=420915 RepID=UPI000231AD84|nr:GNAT family N-acetyltransferase [Pseudoalteromonas sp. BSi20439]GAA71402.1 hypothetical protein P20439_1475 [Pseudoalteromonas sp. BSi20439]